MRPPDTGVALWRLGASFAALYFIQSLADPSSGILTQPVRSLLHRWGESPATIALFMALVSLPWSVKPVFGLLSDFVPLFGSKRRNYLILSGALAVAGFAVLTLMPLERGDWWWLLALLLLPGIGIAFGDVLIDAVMVDEGQPSGLTGVLQSIQWTAGYAGMLLTGVLGGYLAAIERPDLAFGLCAGVWCVSLVLSALVIRDRPTPAFRADEPHTLRETWTALRSAFRHSGMLPIALFLLLWNFNPLWTTVLYLHFTGPLAFSEETFGVTISIFSAGSMLAALTYPLYCRRVALGRLIHISIVTGAAANVFYWFVWDLASAYLVALLGGVAYMAGTMIQMDIAARRVPPLCAATMFALLMALSNLSASLSEAAGGALYEALQPIGDAFAYDTVVGVSTLLPLCCLVTVPWLRRIIPEWFQPGAAEAIPAAE